MFQLFPMYHKNPLTDGPGVCFPNSGMTQYIYAVLYHLRNVEAHPVCDGLYIIFCYVILHVILPLIRISSFYDV